MNKTVKKKRSAPPPSEAKKEPKFTAFTIQADRLMAVVTLDVIVSPMCPEGKRLPKEMLQKCKAVWSPGVTRSQLTTKLIGSLGLEKERLDDRDGSPLYMVDIQLPNKIRFSAVTVGEMKELPIQEKVDCTIGMDIIRYADCSISHKDRKTFFSFRVPSLGGVDYVKLVPGGARARREVVTTMARRNQMCPCGSGMKYKNCCGKLI